MNRKALLLLASFGAFLALGDRYIISVFYKQYMANYNINSKVLFSLIFSAFYIGYTLTQIPGGRLAEKFGPSKISGISMVAWSILLALLTMEKSFFVAIALAFTMGIAQGPIFPAIMYLTRLHYEDHEYARATAYISSMGDASPAIIPIVSFIIFDYSGNFFLPVLIFAGTGIIIGLVLLSLNINYLRDQRLGKWRMLLTREFWIFGFSFFLYDFYFYIFLTWYPAFLFERYGVAGNNFVFFTLPWIFMAFSAILSGIILDRVNNDALISSVSYLAILVSMVLSFIFDNAYEFIILITVMLSLLNPILLSSWRLSTRIAGKNRSAFVGGWINMWGNLGGITAPLVLALLMSLIGLKYIFLYASVIPLGGLITWNFLGKIKNDEKGYI